MFRFDMSRKISLLSEFCATDFAAMLWWSVLRHMSLEVCVVGVGVTAFFAHIRLFTGVLAEMCRCSES